MPYDKLSLCLLASTLACAASVRAVRAETVEVAACGQTVERSQIGLLTADLDCSAFPYGVQLLAGAKLDLNGHAIHGGDLTKATILGVGSDTGRGRARFTIIGPGEISGEGRPFPAVGTWACVQASDGSVRMTSGTGVIDVHGCSYGVLGSTTDASGGRARVQMDHVRLHDLVLDATAVASLKATDVEASTNGRRGLAATKRLVLRNVVASAHRGGPGVFTQGVVKGVGLSALRNAIGVEAWRGLAVTDLRADDNDYFGAIGGRTALKQASVVGNGAADLVTDSAPSLRGTVCGSSLDFGAVSWRKCTNE